METARTPARLYDVQCMRCSAAFLLILFGCVEQIPSPAPPIVDAPAATSVGAVSDLHFTDEGLQFAAEKIVREAERRGIDVAHGRTRLERLLWLEAVLGGSTHALARTNVLVGKMTATDSARWAKLRQRAALEFEGRDDAAAARVTDLLKRWQQRKTETVFRYLSSNYAQRYPYINSRSWEHRFHEFISDQPVDAATWGWLVLREYDVEAKQQYGRATSETAYAFYLEFSGLGNARDARRIFSVPGVEIRNVATHSPAASPFNGE